MSKSIVAALVAASLAIPLAPALALDATVTQVDKNPDGTSTFQFTIRTEANETLSPGQPVTAGDFVTIYNFYGFVENSAKSPDGWVFSSEEFGRTPMLNGYPMVAPIDIPNTPNLTWTVTKPVAAGAQVTGFTATTRMVGTTQGQYSAHPQPRCRSFSCGTDQACSEQVELCPPVALAFDQLQPGDLSLDLAAAPGQRQGCAHGLLVLAQAGGEAVQLAVLGIGQPRGERIRRAGTDQGTKAKGEVTSHGQRWRLPQQPLDVAAVRICKHRQVSREHPGRASRRVCRRPRRGLHSRDCCWPGLSFHCRQPLPVGPLGDDAHSALEPEVAQVPPEPGAIAAALPPAPLQHRPPRVEQVDPWPVQLGLLATHPAPHRVAGQSQVAGDVAGRNALLMQPDHLAMDLHAPLPALPL